MKRTLLVAGTALGAAILVRGAVRKCKGLDFGELVERMPENAPPKWMFRNVSDIRANTERILELLAADRTAVPETRERVPA